MKVSYLGIAAALGFGSGCASSASHGTTQAGSGGAASSSGGASAGDGGTAPSVDGGASGSPNGGETGEATAGGESGQAGEAKAGASSTASNGSLHYGLVNILPSGPSGGTNVTAFFNANSANDEPTTIASKGDCKLVSVPTPSTDPTTTVSAGTLTIAGGRTPIMLQPTGTMGSVAYTTGLGPVGQQIFPGNHLIVTASGDVVPQFSQPIGVPEPITLVEPDLLHANGVLVLSRTGDNQLRWAGGGADGVFDFELSRQAAGKSVSLGCRFPLAAGSGVIPAGLLSQLSPANSTDQVSLFSQVLTQETARTGDWMVTVSVMMNINFSGVNVKIVSDLPAQPAEPPPATACPAGTDSACTSLDNIQFPATLQCSTEAPPSMVGGTIVPGTYLMTSDVAYFPNGATVPDACNTIASVVSSRVLFVGDGCLSTLGSDSQGHTANKAATFSASGHTLASTQTCPAQGTESLSYTATRTSLLLLGTSSDGRSELQTYLLY
jgi:hypothetical protein